MPSDHAATAASIAAADKHLESLYVLCGILSSGIDRARRNLRQIRAEAAAAQKHDEQVHAVPSELGVDMLG